jgi:outer membrane protein TolC
VSGHPCRKRPRNLWYSAGYVASATRQRLDQLGPTVSYALDIFGGTRRQVEEQSTLADCQRYQVDAAYLTLTGNSVTQAIQIAATRAQLEAIDGVLDIDRQNVDLVSKERQARSVPGSDVVAAESQLAADETLQPGADQQLSVAKHELSVLLGGAPGDWSPPGFDLASLTLSDQLAVSLPSELVHQRPDILAAEAQLHAASAQIGVATAQLYLSITLSQRQYEQALLGYIRTEAQRYQGTMQLFAAMGGGWPDARLAATGAVGSARRDEHD